MWTSTACSPRSGNGCGRRWGGAPDVVARLALGAAGTAVAVHRARTAAGGESAAGSGAAGTELCRLRRARRPLAVRAAAQLAHLGCDDCLGAAGHCRGAARAHRRRTRRARVRPQPDARRGSLRQHGPEGLRTRQPPRRPAHRHESRGERFHQPPRGRPHRADPVR